MANSEAARADLYTGLAEVLGSDRAETLMAHLPRFEAAELATTADVAATRDDIASLRSELKGDIGSLRSDLKGDFREVSDGLKNANRRLDKLFLALVAGLFVVIAAMASLVFTVS